MEQSDPDDARRAAEFAEAFDRFAPMVLRFAWRRLGDQDVAWDVVSDTFTVAWRRWDRRPDPERRHLDPDGVLPWLYAIAGNAIRVQVRARGRRTRLTARLNAVRGPAPIPDPADAVVLGHSLAAAMTRLSESDQELLRLVAWEHLDDARSLGLALGISAPTARVRLHRARQRLHALLAEPPAHGQADPLPTMSAAVQAPREGDMTCTTT